jgi:hypothetical protein
MAKTKKQLEEELLRLKVLLDEQTLLLAKNELLNKPSKQEDNLEIKLTKMIRVTSLYHGVLNLKTSIQSDAQIFTFNFFGYEQPIFYSDLIRCINAQRRLFADGFCYINDKDIVTAHYLDKEYEVLLNKDQIFNYMEFDSDFIVARYKQLPVQQKITLLETIAFKLNKNENIDRNKIDLLAKAANVDIYELANKLK